MKILDLPSLDYLGECFMLEGGQLRWKRRPERHFATQKAWLIWNTRFAGKTAGRVMVGKKSYVQIGLNDRRFLAHRIIAKMWGIAMTGEIDHKDGNGLNNLPSNLRPATRSENNRNGPGWAKKGGIAGVRWSKTHGKWQAYVRVAGKQTHLGFFDDEQSAINARIDAELIHYGKFAPSTGASA